MNDAIPDRCKKFMLNVIGNEKASEHSTGFLRLINIWIFDFKVLHYLRFLRIPIDDLLFKVAFVARECGAGSSHAEPCIFFDDTFFTNAFVEYCMVCNVVVVTFGSTEI